MTSERTTRDVSFLRSVPPAIAQVSISVFVIDTMTGANLAA